MGKKVSRQTRSKRLSVAVTPDGFDFIQEAAEYAGVSANAWAAQVLVTSARSTVEGRQRALKIIETEFAASLTRGVDEQIAASLGGVPDWCKGDGEDEG